MVVEGKEKFLSFLIILLLSRHHYDKFSLSSDNALSAGVCVYYDYMDLCTHTLTLNIAVIINRW